MTDDCIFSSSGNELSPDNFLMRGVRNTAERGGGRIKTKLLVLLVLHFKKKNDKKTLGGRPTIPPL